MKKSVELLAPVGDFECLKAAVQNGADSVYLGGSLFNARASATNFDFDELEKVINYCSLRNVKTHLTLNTLLKDYEIKDAVYLAKTAYEYGIDALIVQDIGLAKILMKLFPDIDIHASTQMTIHNLEGVQKLQKLGFKRVVLARELSIEEIEYICNNSNIEIETFVHGALCISYSGQCLFSSMVGGRSGNRGRCAQPCRLPYELIEKKSNGIKTTDKIIDKGFLISPRDFCSLEYLPDLINAGVDCFKIEGRLKTPDYVATVTRIYRKYIDLFLSGKNYIIDEKDLHDLKQVFNRGEFSAGHLSTKENQNLVFKEKSNHMGIYIGNVAGYNKLKGHIKLQLNSNIAIGDTINFEKENTKYTVSELCKNNSNIPSAGPGSKVIIGRMKGNIHIGDKVYKLASKTLSTQAKASYEMERKKLPLKCLIFIKKNEPVAIEVSIKSSNKLYKNICVKIHSDLIPEESINSPITKERVIAQFSKTTDTPFEFTEFEINMDKNVFLPSIRKLNEIRRMALSKIENIVISRIKRNSQYDEEKLEKICNKFLSSAEVKNLKYDNNKHIAVYFNIINPEFDYSKLSSKYISCTYIPLRYFMNKKYVNALKQITSNFKTYIYMPAIIKANYKNIIKHGLEDIIRDYNICGFVVSNLADFELLDKYKTKYEFIGNFTLNAFNTTSVNVLKSFGLSRVTLSEELNENNISNIVKIEKGHVPLELIVYGKAPIMKMNYCVLGCSNKCYPQCKMRCTLDAEYFLRDRLGFNFRILPDNIQTVTTIFNSKTTSFTHIDFGLQFLRLDILDESIEEINTASKAAFEGIQLQGKQYTYGNLNREV